MQRFSLTYFNAFICLQVILTEVYSIGFCCSFFDEEDLPSIAEHDVIYDFQAPAIGIRAEIGFDDSL